MKKLLMIIVAFLCFFCVNAGAFEGNGTKASPYVITDAAEFVEFATLINQGADGYDTAYYELWADIDFEEIAYVIPGNAENTFKGVFNGKGYKLSNISITGAGSEYISSNTFTVGAFGYAENALFADLHIDNMIISISNDTVNPELNIGLLAGKLGKTSSNTEAGIVRCSTSGTITVAYNGADVVAGGVCGNVVNNAPNSGINISDCYSDAVISVSTKNSVYIGGLLGRALSRAVNGTFSIRKCYSNGDVSVTPKAMFSVTGGIVGEAVIDNEHGGWASLLAESTVPVSDCYYAGTMSGNGNWKYEGSICGYVNGVEIDNCYTAQSSYYCSNGTYCRSGIIVSGSANESFFKTTLGFDFTNNWAMSGTYPTLKYIHNPKAIVKGDKLAVSLGSVDPSVVLVAFYNMDNKFLGAHIREHKAGNHITYDVDIFDAATSYKIIFFNNIVDVSPIINFVEGNI